jgi:hypothetical protein
MTHGHRAPTELLVDLLQLEERIRPDQREPGKPVTVSWGDCQRLSNILLQIGRDEDPREHYWRSVPNRPRKVSRQDWIAAFLYLAAVETGRKSDKVLRGEIASLTGLTDTKVDHAVRDHKEDAGGFVKAATSKGALPALIGMYTELARQREK